MVTDLPPAQLTSKHLSSFLDFFSYIRNRLGEIAEHRIAFGMNVLHTKGKIVITYEDRVYIVEVRMQQIGDE